MIHTTTVTRMRNRRRQNQRRSPFGRLGLGCSGALALLLALAGVSAALAYSRAVRDLPSIETIPGMLEPPGGELLQPTRLVDRSGTRLLLELQNPAAAGSRYLRAPGEDVPQGESFSPALVTATLAAADPHNRAIPLAQRLVSELLLADEPAGLRRALRERLLAVQLVQRFGGRRVLEWYLNSADYGRLAYGADAAARVYLGKPASGLNLAEAALLAAAAIDPSQNPHDAPQAALARQKQVLEAALRHHLAGPLEAAQAAQLVVQIAPVARPGQALRLDDLQPAVDPAPLALALQQAQTQIPLRRLLRGGLTLRTAIDFDLQQQTACALAAQIARLGHAAAPTPDDCPAARLMPALDVPAPAKDAPAAAALALDPQSGQILALAVRANAGSPNAAQAPAAGEDDPFFSAAELPARPAGTLGLPWLYLTAFTRGLSPGSLTWDIAPSAASKPPAPTADAAAPAEPPGDGPLRLRMALANDRLRPAAQILEQVGAQNIWQTARQFGLADPENRPADAAVQPDTLFRPLTLLELAQAYGVLANEGVLAGRSLTRPGVGSTLIGQTPPPLHALALLAVEDSRGRTLLDWSAWQTRPIVSAPIAYLMNNTLSDETARWPSLGRPNPLEIGLPAAAKLGLTADGRDAWTIGYTHARLVGVWLGRSAASASADANAPDGAEMAPSDPLAQAGAGLYHALMKYAHRDLPADEWAMPAGVQVVKVCDPSGMLPTANCPNVVDEVYLEANRPLQADRMFRSVAVDRLTGRLATIFTPLDQVVEQSYMQVPAQAAEWARRSGQKTPPDVYDTIDPVSVVNPKLKLAAPGMFAVVRGNLTLRGALAVENLDFYHIQVGQGMNPQSWVQVGDDARRQPTGDVLGEWDTRGLSGLYTIELVAVDRDKNVQRAHVIVSVDNQPPQVEIVSPAAQEEIALSERPEVVLLAEVHDDLETARVELYLDGRRLISSAAAPYAYLWACTPGAHSLRVVAIDQAGNVTEASSSFTVTQ